MPLAASRLTSAFMVEGICGVWLVSGGMAWPGGPVRMRDCTARPDRGPCHDRRHLPPRTRCDYGPGLPAIIDSKERSCTCAYRSEERRVGEEFVRTCRSRWWSDHHKKKKRQLVEHET